MIFANDVNHAGNTYSIKNIGSGTARVFFAQARQMRVESEE
jgi:centromere protein C